MAGEGAKSTFITCIRMPVHSAIENQVFHVLTDKLIPWANEGAPFVLFSAPPTQIGMHIITEEEGKKLPLQRGGIGNKVHAQFWREENLNAVAVPYMGCVVEGEADITLGTTTAMCRKLGIPGKRWVLQAPQKCFFLTPPHYPISSGGGVHWQRPHPERAHSRIFWMQFYPTGVLCHFCSCEKGRHWNHPHCFITGSETFPIAETLMREMTGQAPRYVPMVYFNLGILLNLMARDILQGAKSHPENGLSLSSAGTSPLQAALDYIGGNLAHRLMTVETIAAHAHLSPRHLARTFKREMEMTVMEYVFQSRMTLAGRLLRESTFSVRKIATSCGYVSAAPFIKAFQRHYHCSPSEYRHANSNDGRSD